MKRKSSKRCQTAANFEIQATSMTHILCVLFINLFLDSNPIYGINFIGLLSIIFISEGTSIERLISILSWNFEDRQRHNNNKKSNISFEICYLYVASHLNYPPIELSRPNWTLNNDNWKVAMVKKNGLLSAHWALIQSESILVGVFFFF